MPSPNTICTIRHFATGHNSVGEINSVRDEPLSKTGLEQANLIPDRLANYLTERYGERWTDVYNVLCSSDMQRAIQSAEPLARDARFRYLGTLARMAYFREADGGNFVGKPYQATQEKYGAPWTTLVRGKFDFREANGEAFEDVWNRVAFGINSIWEEQNRPIIVLHGVVEYVIHWMAFGSQIAQLSPNGKITEYTLPMRPIPFLGNPSEIKIPKLITV